MIVIIITIFGLAKKPFRELFFVVSILCVCFFCPVDMGRRRNQWLDRAVQVGFDVFPRISFIIP